MLPTLKGYEKARRRLEGALEQDHDSADTVVERFLAAVADVLELDSSCWHHTDPVSGFPISWSGSGDPPGSVAEALQYEFARPDVNRLSELNRRPVGVSSIATATGDKPASSLRFREMIAPTGIRDELRISCKDAFGTWSVVVGFTRRRLTDVDVGFVSEVLPVLTQALRRTTASGWSASRAGPVTVGDSSGPAVLVLDAADHIVAADAVARRRLELLGEHLAGQVPGLIAYLAGRVRSGEEASAAARMRVSDGRWFLIDASVMDDAAGSVAVVMQPAPASEVLAQVLRAYGLSARERQVASLLAQGHSTKSIAATLVISPWTVQDHVKAIYQKTGLGTRSELSSLGGV